MTKPYAASGAAEALCVVRHRFDQLLCRAAEGAGATVVLRAGLAGVDRHRHGRWDIAIGSLDGQTHRVSARSVVDATGRRASFARQQGARRLHHGDLLAIVGWFDGGDPLGRDRALLAVESCPSGWWSLSTGADGSRIATLYTSTWMMKAARATPEAWWAHALGEAPGVRRAVARASGDAATLAVFRASPSRSSLLCGDGWIAVGEAAIALDPLGGQGVAVALETAFRAFEAATVDPSWGTLGGDYRDALIARLDAHLDGRARVYQEAAAVLPEPFFRHAVWGHAGED